MYNSSLGSNDLHPTTLVSSLAIYKFINNNNSNNNNNNNNNSVTIGHIYIHVDMLNCASIACILYVKNQQTYHILSKKLLVGQTDHTIITALNFGVGGCGFF